MKANSSCCIKNTPGASYKILSDEWGIYQVKLMVVPKGRELQMVFTAEGGNQPGYTFVQVTDLTGLEIYCFFSRRCYIL